MRTSVITSLTALLMTVGCRGGPDLTAVKAGNDVKVETTDRVTLSGRVIEVQPEAVVIEETPGGVRTRVLRSNVASIEIATSTVPGSTAAGPPVTAPPEADPPAPPPEAVKPIAENAPAAAEAAATEAAPAKVDPPVVREVLVPEGTVLLLTLETAVASDTSKVEDPVRARTRSAIKIEGMEVLPAGTTLIGVVSEAQRSAKVKGRAQVAVRFHTLRPPDGPSYDIRTSSYAREAEGTKKKDAKKIAIPAAGGAIIGGIIGGGKGAAIGGAIGGGAGTAAVLTSRGDEASVPAGQAISVTLLAPLTLRVPGS